MANGLLFKELLQTPNFRITVVEDADTVELCGALKVKPAFHSCSRRAVPGAWPLSAGLALTLGLERALCSVPSPPRRIVYGEPCSSLPALPSPFLGAPGSPLASGLLSLINRGELRCFALRGIGNIHIREAW